MSAKSILCLALCLASPALAADRGPAGLTRMPFTAHNADAGDISCSVSLAHWYSDELGRAAPGAAVTTEFWKDPASGTLYLLNETGDRMAVQMIWCGQAGRAWETRSTLVLAASGESDFTCKAEGDALVCR